MVAKEQSANELRSKKTEVEQFEGALEQLGKQYEHLQKKVCLLLIGFLKRLNVLRLGVFHLQLVSIQNYCVIQDLRHERKESSHSVAQSAIHLMVPGSG